MSTRKEHIITKERLESAIILSMEINFSAWLQKEIDGRGWSWNKLAEVAGLASGTIYNIRDGTRGVGESSVSAIAKALKISEEEVFRAAGLLKQKQTSDRAERLLYQIDQLDEQDWETIELLVGAFLEKRNKKNTVTKTATT